MGPGCRTDRLKLLSCQMGAKLNHSKATAPSQQTPALGGERQVEGANHPGWRVTISCKHCHGLVLLWPGPEAEVMAGRRCQVCLGHGGTGHPGSTGERRAPRRGMAAGDRLAPRWQMGSWVGAGGESPRAGCEAGGTQSLSVLSGGNYDGSLPSPPKGRDGGVRKARQGGGARGRGMCGGRPCQAAPNAETGALLPGQGQPGGLAVQGGMQPPEDTTSVVCRGWLLLPLPPLDQLLLLLR